MWLRLSAVVLSLLVVTHAHVSREKRQLSLNGQRENFEVYVKPLLENNPSGQFQPLQTPETPQKFQYQLPLPPQPKPHFNVQQLPPGVTYNIQTNVQATPFRSQKQQYEPLIQSTTQQERNRPQYKLPILPQHDNSQSQFSFHPQSKQHQNLQLKPLGQQLSPQQGGNQQVIYINGQPVVINAPKDQSLVTPTIQQQSGSQGISFSTSHSTEVIRQGKIGSVQPSVQSVIQKAPASEIEFNKGPTVKDKDGKQDEYVIYYYYYYDDDANKTNPTLNFDDIPNLETYDQSQGGNAKDKAQRNDKRTGIPQNVINNAFKDNNDFSVSQSASQASGQDGVLTGDLKSGGVSSVSVSAIDDSPISNIYRYGNNVPRFPISPNLVDRHDGGPSEISNKGITNDHKSDLKTLINGSGGSDKTPLPTSALSVNKESNNEEKFERNNEVIETKTEAETTEAITTTTEVTTTTEEPTTTTERNRRRTFGSRGRFGTRRRRPGAFNIHPRRPKLRTTTTSESTIDEETSTKGYQPRTIGRQRNRFRSSFRRNRFRNSNVDKEEAEDEKKEITTTEPSSYGTTRRRFGSSRRYGTTRNSGRSSSEDNEEVSTSKPTRAPASFLSRRRKLNRPRLSFLRGGRRRFGHPDEEKEEKEEVEETTITSTLITDAPETTVTTLSPTEPPEKKEDQEPDDVVAQETTTTESSRFAGLFRRRKRPSIFGKRPSFLNRSR